MRQINRVLAALAVAVLLVALTLLSWLRRQTLADLERDVQGMVQSFVAEALLHGPGGDSLARFELAEALVQRGLKSPYIQEAVVGLTLPGRPEIVIVPFTFAADHAGDPRQALAGLEAYPLGGTEAPFGRLYLLLDRSMVQRINWAIGAIALAVILTLVTLLARVWSQETSLTRTVIELNERRRELIRLERLALAGQLSAGLLHDLRKPVLNIHHGLDEMAEALGDFAPAAAPLQDLRRNTRLFFEILGESQIERFVRSDRVGEEYLDIGAVLDASLNLVRYEQRGVQVERRQGEDLPSIYAQPFKLIQLFSNLILNAYQALDGHGQLCVDVTAADGGVLVRLTDTGPGIPPEIQERIFEPFFSTKAEGEGTGLGLSICRLIVEEQGGSLRVESRAGGPTSFVVWLPGEAASVKKDRP
jgi:signal transduction histidine kinase